jgi:deoxyribose-phosphate aldolase
MTPAEFAKYIDQTLLKPDSTRQQAKAFCEEAKLHGFASVCLLPSWVPDATDILEGTSVAVCTVIGFPHGIASTQAKVHEVLTVTADGATEVDMVLNISAMKSGADLLVFDDIQQVVDAASLSGAIVKVIFECAYLTDEEKRRACRMCVEAGAAFVKTSTGFAPTGATLEDVKLMRQMVEDNCGVKAAGGIRTLADALAMIEAGASRLGTSAGVALLEAFTSGETKPVVTGY